MNAPLPAKATHAIEAEQSLLGAMLTDPKAFDRVAEVLVAGDFFEPEHQLIFGAMRSLHEDGKSWDLIVVFEMLGRPERGMPGHLVYLNQLVTASPGPANAAYYAAIIRERSRKRALLAVADSIAAAVGTPMGPSVEKIVATTDVALQAVLDRNAGELQDLDASMDEVFAYIESRQDAAARDQAIATGLTGVDRAIGGGIEPGQLVVIGGRAGMGKTVFGLHIAERAAAAKKSVFYATLEMTRREIAARILAKRSAVSTIEMRTIGAEAFPWKALLDARSEHGQRLYIDDRPAIGLGYLRAVARRQQRQHGLDLVVVDHIGLMQAAGENRVQQIGAISRGRKALAKELHVPIVALAQLNRGVEARVDKRPMLSDLRESGDIEQDADVVLMLHRESIYSTDPQWAGLAEILIRKNRHGATCEVLIEFDARLGIVGDHVGSNPRVTSIDRTSTRLRGLA